MRTYNLARFPCKVPACKGRDRPSNQDGGSGEILTRNNAASLWNSKGPTHLDFVKPHAANMFTI